MQPKIVKQMAPGAATGFTLLEVISALGILSIITSSAMVIMSRNRQSAYDLTMRLRALEVARENMEQMLVLDSIEEQTDFGISEKYPAIEWESTIETFYAPLEGQTWARALSIARYKNMQDEDQEIELEHWLCRVTEADMEALGQLEGSETGLLESIQEAADFAGVDPDQVRAWLENGMVQTEEGYFIEANLALFMRTEGFPSQEELDGQATTGVFKDEFEDFPTEQDMMDVREEDVLGERRGR